MEHRNFEKSFWILFQGTLMLLPQIGSEEKPVKVNGVSFVLVIDALISLNLAPMLVVSFAPNVILEHCSLITKILFGLVKIVRIKSIIVKYGSPFWIH